MIARDKTQRGNRMDWLSSLPAWVSSVVGIITVLGGGGIITIAVNAFIAARKLKNGNEKLKADAKKTSSEADNLDAVTESQQIDNLFKIMDRMERDYNCLVERVAELEQEIKELREQLKHKDADMNVLHSQLRLEKNRKEYAVEGWRVTIGQLIENEIEPETELPSWAEEI